MPSRRLGFFIFLCVCAFLSFRAYKVRQSVDEGGRRSFDSSAPVQVREVAGESGLHFTHITIGDIPGLKVSPWATAFGAAVSVVDINNDGFMDLFFTQTRAGIPNELYINQGGFQFKKSEVLGLQGANNENASVRSLFFDCDNDGRQDLFLTTLRCPMIYRQNSQARFEPGRVEGEAGACVAAEAVNTLDINRDGYLDVITGGNNGDSLEFKTLPKNFINARNGALLTAWINDGRCNFKSSSEFLNAEGRFFYHSLGVGDLRGSGRKDIWAATDFNSDKIFLSEGEKYKLTTMEKTNSRFGMNSEIFYLEGELNPFVFVTHTYRLGYLVGGNMLWNFKNDGFIDEGVARGVRKCGWAWGGRAVDFENDGDLDLAVANGFVSGDAKQDYWYKFSVMTMTAQDIGGNPAYWAEMKGKNFSGHERDCLFLNQKGVFSDVGLKAGFDPERLDGRGVAVIDVDNDGVQEVVVSNLGGRAYLYKFEKGAESPAHWIGFRLSAARGPREALGAKVTLTAGRRVLRRELFTANTFSAQSDPRVHFGLGEISKIDEVKIDWPSGRTTVLKSPAVNVYHAVGEIL